MVGDSVSFNMQVIDNIPLTITMLKDGVPFSPFDLDLQVMCAHYGHPETYSYVVIYRHDNLQLSDAGTYVFKITNGVDTVNSHDCVVSIPLLIATQPMPRISVAVGGILTVNMVVEDTAAVTVTMLKNGMPFTPDNSNLVVVKEHSDIYIVTYTKENFALIDTGIYVFHISDGTYSLNSNECLVTAPTTRLTEIAAEIAIMVAGIRIADGYYNDWGSVNKQDAARATAWPRAEIRYQSQVPGGGLSHYYGMLNAEFIIEIEPKITPSGTVDSVLDADAYMDTALADLLKMSLGNNGYLALSGEAVLTFKDARRETVKNGDVYRPGKLITKWNVHYHNS